MDFNGCSVAGGSAAPCCSATVGAVPVGVVFLLFPLVVQGEANIVHVAGVGCVSQASKQQAREQRWDLFSALLRFACLLAACCRGGGEEFVLLLLLLHRLCCGSVAGYLVTLRFALCCCCWCCGFNFTMSLLLQPARCVS